MKKTLRICFFLLFLFFFSLTGVTGVRKAYSKKNFWNPAEGVEAGDTWINNNLYQRKKMLAPYQIWNAVIDKRYFPEINAYISPNGQTLMGSPSPRYRLYTDKVQQLASWCKDNGINFLYVIYPGKPETDTELTDIGIPCFRNYVADQADKEYAEKQIPFLDLRECFRVGEDFYSFFYKTEHHWTADAGIKAAREIVKHLNEDYDMGLDASRLDEEKIGRTVYPGIFVGEQGKKMLGKYGKRDDFIVRFPLYDAQLHYICAEDKIDVFGGFDILTEEERLSENHFNEDKSLYYYYLFKNSGLIEIWDKDVTAGDIFLINDSFSNVVTPFLSLAAKHITVWDMRKDQRIYQYLNDHPEIETVIIAYTIASVSTHQMHDFQ